MTALCFKIVATIIAVALTGATLIPSKSDAPGERLLFAGIASAVAFVALVGVWG